MLKLYKIHTHTHTHTHIYIYIYIIILWVSVSWTGKVFDNWIRELGFNFSLHQKQISLNKQNDPSDLKTVLTLPLIWFSSTTILLSMLVNNTTAYFPNSNTTSSVLTFWYRWHCWVSCGMHRTCCNVWKWNR